MGHCFHLDWAKILSFGQNVKTVDSVGQDQTAWKMRSEIYTDSIGQTIFAEKTMHSDYFERFPCNLERFSFLLTVQPFSTQWWFLTLLGSRPFENIVGKGENTGCQHCLLFPQCVLPFQIHIWYFEFILNVSSANAYNLEKVKTFVIWKRFFFYPADVEKAGWLFLFIYRRYRFPIWTTPSEDA